MSERTRIYARVSSDRQKAEGTITNQVGPGVLRDIARMGMELTGIYTDDGKSASTGKMHLRGDFQKMLVDASRREFDVLWVADLDRVTRSNDWGELGLIFGPLQKAGVKLAGPNLAPMELGNTMSMMQIMLRVSIAYEDNQKRVANFAIGKRAAALRGAHVQGPIPYGLVYVAGKARDGSGWSEHPTRAEHVRQIFARAVRGESGPQIAKAFELAGIPGPQVNDKYPKGGRWAGGVARILRSPVYRGLHHWADVAIPVPRLVSDETWFAAQAAVGVSKKKNLGTPLGLYLCHQLAVCSVCSSPMYVKHAQKSGAPMRRYVCRDNTHRRPVDRPKCKLPSFPVDRTDDVIWSEVSQFLKRPTVEIVADLRGHAVEHSEEAQAWASDAERYAAQLVEVERREKTIMELIMSGIVETSNGKQQLTENAARRAHLQAQLKTAQEAASDSTGAVTSARDLERLVGELAALAADAEPAERRKLVRMLVAPGGITFDAFGCNVRLVFGGERTDVKAPNPGSAIGAPERAVTLRVVAK